MVKFVSRLRASSPNRKNFGRLIREWGGFVMGLAGCLFGILGYQHSKENTRVTNALQADVLLRAAWDLLGGVEGTPYINVSSITKDPTKLELVSRKLTMADMLVPGYYFSFQVRAMYYFAKGDFNAGMNEFKRAKESNPTRSEAYSTAAFFYLHYGQYADALKEYEQLIAMEPANVEWQTNMGFTLRYLHRFTEARKHLNKALRLNPAYLRAYDNLASLLDSVGKRDSALFIRQLRDSYARPALAAP